MCLISQLLIPKITLTLGKVYFLNIHLLKLSQTFRWNCQSSPKEICKLILFVDIDKLRPSLCILPNSAHA